MINVKLVNLVITDGKNEYELADLTKKQFELAKKELQSYNGHGTTILDSKCNKKLCLNWNKGFTSEILEYLVEVK